VRESNRRNYFRIDDRLGLSYQILDKLEYQQFQQEHRLQRIEEHQQRDLEHKIHNAIRSLQIRNPELGNLLNLLNQRIEKISRTSHQKTIPVDNDSIEPRPVNISASGIAFFQEKPLAENTPLKMVLTLYPDMEKINLFGEVVSCVEHHSAELEHYRISVEFEYLVEEDRDELVQYIMKQQNIALRKNSGIDEDFE